jgi:hypothetical protein
MTNWSNKKKMTPKQVEVSLYIYIYIVFHAIIDIDIATHPALQSFQIHLVCCHSTIINCTPRVLTTASPISFGRFVVYLFPFSHFTIVFFFFCGIFPWPIIPRLHHSAEPGWHLVMHTIDKPSHFMRQTWCSVK